MFFCCSYIISNTWIVCCGRTILDVWRGSQTFQLDSTTWWLVLFASTDRFNCTGAIAADWERCVVMTWLWRQGPIPTELGNLTSVRNLYLHRNHFTGSMSRFTVMCNVNWRDEFFVVVGGVDVNVDLLMIPHQEQFLKPCGDWRHWKNYGLVNEGIQHVLDEKVSLCC